MLKDLLAADKATELSEEIGYLMSEMNVLLSKERRPWDEFFAVFKPPQSKLKHLEQRVVTNILYYRSNYVLICACVILLRVIVNPLLFLSIIGVAAIFYAKRVLRDPIHLKNIGTITEPGKTYAAFISSFFLLYLTGGVTYMIFSVFYSVTICSLHFVFRPRSVNSKANKMYDEMQLSGFSFSSLLGSNASGDTSPIDDPESAGATTSAANGTPAFSFSAGGPNASITQRKNTPAAAATAAANANAASAANASNASSRNPP
jgi:hypothetical protein